MTENRQKLKNKLYLVVFAVLVSFSLYFYLLTIVRGKQNTELAGAISNLRDLEYLQADFSLNNRVLNETIEEREKLNSFILNKGNIADFIQKTEALAKHANVEISKSLSVEKNPQKPKESMIKFSVRAKGTFRDVYYFTILIENLPYKIRIKKIALGTSDADVSSVSSGVAAVAGLKTKTTAAEKNWTSDINFELISYINE